MRTKLRKAPAETAVAQVQYALNPGKSRVALLPACNAEPGAGELFPQT
jgi:hypothetical protein